MRIWHYLCCVATVKIRRTTILSVTATILSLSVLPGPYSVCDVEIAASNGAEKQTFVVRAQDPALDLLRSRMQAARKPDVKRRSDEYYRVQMLMQLAEHYANAASNSARDDSSEKSSPMVTPTPRRALRGDRGVQMASYEAEVVSNSLPSANADTFAWDRYWQSQREQLGQQLAALEPKPTGPEVFRRLEIGNERLASRPVQSWLTAALIGCLTGLLTSQFACVVRRARITMRSDLVLTVPRGWAKERFSWRAWCLDRVWGDWLEGVGIIVLIVFFAT
jgi:hypothetical protein